MIFSKKEDINQEMTKRDFDTRQRFGFRTYKWVAGAASVLLGTSIVFGVQSNTVHADTTDNNSEQVRRLNDQGNNANVIESHVDATIPEEPGRDSHGDPVHEHHEVDYKGLPQDQIIHYTDDHGGKALEKDGKTTVPDAKAGNTDPVKGDVTHSGDTVNVPVPDGWQLKNKDDGKTTLKPDETGKVPDKSIVIKHGEYTTPKGDKSKAGDQIPSTEAQKTGKDNTFARDMEHLTNTTVQDVFNYDYSGVNSKTMAKDEYKNLSKSDTVHANSMRNVIIDTVTGDVKRYGDWDSVQLPSYMIHQIAGYTAVVTDEKGSSVLVNSGVIAGKNLTSDDINNLDVDANGLRVNHTYKVVYRANNGHMKLHFVDKNGNELGTTDRKNQYLRDFNVDNTVSGTTDSNIDLSKIIPAGWEIAGIAPNITVSADTAVQDTPVDIKIQHIIKHYILADNPDKTIGDMTSDDGEITNPIKCDLNSAALSRDMTRTYIGFAMPGRKQLYKDTDTINYERTADLDVITGDVTYSAWTPQKGSKAEFNDYTARDVDGYVFDTDFGGTKTIKGFVPNQGQITDWINGSGASETDFLYKVAQYSVKYQFVDSDMHNSPVSDIITVSGDHDTTVTNLPDLLKAVPTHYKLADGASLPTSVKIGDRDDEAVHQIELVHAIDHLTKDSQIPDGAVKIGGGKVTSSDFTSEVSREIDEKLPDGTVNQHVQKGNVTREGNYDEVTGVVTFGDWSTYTADSYTPTDVKNYTPSLNEVPSMTLQYGVTYDPVVITYNPKEYTRTVHYVNSDGSEITDKDASGNLVQDIAVTGKYGDTVSVQVPDGFKLENSTDKSFAMPGVDSDGNIPKLVVKLAHDAIIVKHDKAKKTGDLLDTDKPNGTRFKDGVSIGDLNQDADREFDFILPDGQDAAAFANKFNNAQAKVTVAGPHKVIVKQTLGYYRDGVVDRITGKLVGYMENDKVVKLGIDGDHGWIPTGSDVFSAIDIPDIPGYEASMKDLGVSHAVVNGMPTSLALYQISFVQSALSAKQTHHDIDKQRVALSETPNHPAIFEPIKPVEPAKPDNSNKGNSKLDDEIDNKDQPDGDNKLNIDRGETTNQNVEQSVLNAPSKTKDNSKAVNETDQNKTNQDSSQNVAKNDVKNIHKVSAKDSYNSARAGKLRKHKTIKNNASERMQTVYSANNAEPNNALLANMESRTINAKSAKLIRKSDSNAARGVNADKLPQTGRTQNNYAAAIGMLLAGLSLFGIAIDRKHRRD